MAPERAKERRKFGIKACERLEKPWLYPEVPANHFTHFFKIEDKLPEVDRTRITGIEQLDIDMQYSPDDATNYIFYRLSTDKNKPYRMDEPDSIYPYIAIPKTE